MPTKLRAQRTRLASNAQPKAKSVTCGPVLCLRLSNAIARHVQNVGDAMTTAVHES